MMNLRWQMKNKAKNVKFQNCAELCLILKSKRVLIRDSNFNMIFKIKSLLVVSSRSLRRYKIQFLTRKNANVTLDLRKL